jgi:hypothetical protein
LFSVNLPSLIASSPSTFNQEMLPQEIEDYLVDMIGINRPTASSPSFGEDITQPLDTATSPQQMELLLGRPSRDLPVTREDTRVTTSYTMPTTPVFAHSTPRPRVDKVTCIPATEWEYLNQS